jgi:histidinol-phosphate aminotransferase
MKVFISKKNHLRDIKRIRIPENRDLNNGLRLNRNERVENWGSEFVKKIFNNQPDWLLSTYPDSSNLYKKLSKHIRVDESKIMLTSGMDGGIKTLYEIMTEPGDHVGVAGPTYAMYYVYSNLFKTNLTEIQYSPETLKLEWHQLNSFIESRPTLLFLPNPNQPVEDSLSKDQIAEIAEKTRNNKTLFVVDEAYHMFGCETALDLIDEYENLVILRTFSKGFGVPSIRLGYMISNEYNMDVLTKTRFAHESDSLKNAVAEYLLDNYQIVETYIDKVIKGRDYVKTELSRLGIKCNGETSNYLLVDLINSTKRDQVVAFLKSNQIYVKGNFNPPWDKYMLITVGPKELMERFIIVMNEANEKFTLKQKFNK